MDSNFRYRGTKAGISAAFWALRGYRRGSQTIPPDGSAFLLLRLEPLHRARLGHGLSRLWLAALRACFAVPVIQLKYIFALHRLDQQFAERPDQGINPAAARSISDVKFVIWS